MTATVLPEIRPPQTAAAAAAVVAGPRSLQSRVARGSAWTLGAFFAAQALRLANNLVLTRFLAPDVFGVTALVYVFLQALEMCSDLGVGPSIIRHEGGNRRFLDTAWTIQAARGGVLWVVSALIAWPLAVLYGKPELAWLLPIAGFSAVTQGLTPTAVSVANRDMAFARLTAFELGGQSFSLAVVCALASVWPTVGAVIVGTLVGACGRLGLAFLVLPGAGNRFDWDREAAASIFHFGKWLTVSTILTYVCMCTDRLILGYVMTSAELGVYAIAWTMAQVLPTVVKSLAGRVFFPLFARLGEADGPEARAVQLRFKAALMAAVLPPICLLSVWGPGVIDLLYDRRYHSAGWMLRVLSAGEVVPVFTALLSPMLLARGDSHSHMSLLTLRAAVLLAGMALGAWLSGPTGLLLGIVAAPILCYPASALVARRYDAWTPRLDLAGFAAAAAFLWVCS